MPAPDLRTCCLLAAVALAGPGCVTNSAPKGWLPTDREAARDAHGSWIEVGRPGDEPFVFGELIAVGPDSFLVLRGWTLVAVSRVRAAEVGTRLFRYASGWDDLATWVGGGTVSALSHGLYFFPSAAGWATIGSIAAAYQSRVPVLDYPEDRWQDFAAYARFPQGLPPGLDRDAIRPRPEHLAPPRRPPGRR